MSITNHLVALLEHYWPLTIARLWCWLWCLWYMECELLMWAGDGHLIGVAAMKCGPIQSIMDGTARPTKIFYMEKKK